MIVTVAMSCLVIVIFTQYIFLSLGQQNDVSSFTVDDNVNGHKPDTLVTPRCVIPKH